MDKVNKKGDISIPFILGIVLLILVLVLLLYFVYSSYSPMLEEQSQKILENL